MKQTVAVVDERIDKMTNLFCVVGRVDEPVQIKELENGKMVAELILRVSKSYKNADGVYEEDKIKCTLWNAVASNANSYIRCGDTVGVRGTISCDDIKSGIKLVVDRLSFLSSSRSEA